MLLLHDDTLAMAWTNASLATARRRCRRASDGSSSGTAPNRRLAFRPDAEAYSSLMLKLPARRLTLILLANSDGLSAPFQLPQGDVTRSLFAMLFLRMFGG